MEMLPRLLIGSALAGGMSVLGLAGRSSDGQEGRF